MTPLINIISFRIWLGIHHELTPLINIIFVLFRCFEKCSHKDHKKLCEGCMAISTIRILTLYKYFFFRFWFGIHHELAPLMNIISSRFWFGFHHELMPLMNIISSRFWFGIHHELTPLINIISFRFWFGIHHELTPLINIIWFWFGIHHKLTPLMNIIFVLCRGFQKWSHKGYGRFCKWCKAGQKFSMIRVITLCKYWFDSVFTTSWCP